jgi:putative Holliday junction resolvase
MASAHEKALGAGAVAEGTPKAASFLALDYGRARIGVAVADPAARLPRPLGTLERINRNEDMRRLRELAREHGAQRVIVGLPLRMDGTRGDMALEAERFAERVRKQLGLPVDLVDERLSSWEAERILEAELGRKFTQRDPAHPSTKKKKEDGRASVDAMAALVILRDYLLQQDAAKEQA